MSPTHPHHLPDYDPPAMGDDLELDSVAAIILAKDSDGEMLGDALRETYDQLYDGQRTGRWNPDQLHKTEKTHMGTLVEINVHRAFEFDDGKEMDYRVGGIEVDCKFSARLGGWMLPREAYLHNHLCLVIWANEEHNRWEAGLVRATPRSTGLDPAADDDLLGAENQDRKRPLTPAGESRIRWLYPSPTLPENLLMHIPAETRERILSAAPANRRKPTGQAKINMLFRLVQHRLVNRGSVVTVAQQKDSPKRARDARKRKHLGKDGILVLGHQEHDPLVAEALGLPVPTKGDFVSARVVPAEPGFAGDAADIEGMRWRLALDEDPVVPAPLMPRVSRRGDDEDDD
jgi:hypothetical protein